MNRVEVEVLRRDFDNQFPVSALGTNLLPQPQNSCGSGNGGVVWSGSKV